MYLFCPEVKNVAKKVVTLQPFSKDFAEIREIVIKSPFSHFFYKKRNIFKVF